MPPPRDISVSLTVALSSVLLVVSLQRGLGAEDVQGDKVWLRGPLFARAHPTKTEDLSRVLSKEGTPPNLKASLIKLIGRSDICRGERLAGWLSAGVGGRGVCGV